MKAPFGFYTMQGLGLLNFCKKEKEGKRKGKDERRKGKGREKRREGREELWMESIIYLLA